LISDKDYIENITLLENVRNEYIEWIKFYADWKLFITLTFKYDYVSTEHAINNYRDLVRTLNEDILGRKYNKKIGHSYFTYILGIEFQQRGVIHFHVLIDDFVNLNLLHKYWNDRFGYAWVQKVELGTEPIVTEYLTKYIVKGGMLQIYKKRIKKLEMKDFPNWYLMIKS
jgi:hypothetical protein